MDYRKLLIDTNILLDVLMRREGFYEYSSKIWKLCEIRKATGFISSVSVTDIIYIMRKQLDPQKIKTLITSLSQVFEIADIRASDIKTAANLCMSDYEDALQICCAERIGADCIITRNIADFKGGPVQALTPQEFINIMK